MYSVESALVMFCGAFSRLLRIPLSMVCWIKRLHNQLYDCTTNYMTQRNTMKNINVIAFDNLEIIWRCIKETFVSSFSNRTSLAEHGRNLREQWLVGAPRPFP